MKNKDGELVETEKEVKEVYTELFKDLLSTWKTMRIKSIHKKIIKATNG